MGELEEYNIYVFLIQREPDEKYMVPYLREQEMVT
jgi:hypothetical protein